MTNDTFKLLISFYGDDFTGSTDSMEALAINGVRTVLFLEPPTPQLIAERFADIQGFGVAGVSRAMGPDEMNDELRSIFETLKLFPTPIVHYKMCSTFDSSPTVGSIGKAIDIAADIFREQSYMALLVGAPVLKRYTVFGNHYATVSEETLRLDRHPTMSRHPVTPMDEADLRIHLAQQTAKTIALMDILDLEGDSDLIRHRLEVRLTGDPDILLFDVLDDERLRKAGELIWKEALVKGNRFVVGSSGIEYALTAHWQAVGMLKKNSDLLKPRGPVDRILAVSGSCSPVTELQLKYALDNGFVGVKVTVEKLIDPSEAEQTRRDLFKQASEILDRGKSPLLYTAMGSEDLSIPAIKQKLVKAGYASSDSGRLIGEQLGILTKEIVAEKKLTRLLVAGGDTSGFVTRELGIYALEVLMPLAPGSPLCQCYSEDSRFDGIEVVLKGGQVGKEDYFVRVLEGR